ncbi:MAG: ornithine cyclodeaminase family protein [Bryobacteraceae bacterium]|jgi:ornithine cyclodeaminase/alanine dehydrogenase-like protein (mu-crystallin family)
MLFLTESEIRELLPMTEAIRLVRLAFEALARGEAQSQPRRRLMLKTGSILHQVPGAYGKYFGLKFYATNPKFGADFLFALYDAETARPLALMQANWLGQIRTGAASGYATSLMANPEADALGVIGAGFQARSQVEAVRAVRPIRTVRVWSRSQEKREKFAAEVNATVSASAEEAVRGAQIVVTATWSKDPVVDDAWIGPGVHINAMGSNMPNRRELPEALVRRADVIAVDALDAAKNEAGDLILPDCWSNVVELQSVTACWRPNGISIFKSVGLGMEDVAVGSFVYEQAVERGVGKSLYS